MDLQKCAELAHGYTSTTAAFSGLLERAPVVARHHLDEPLARRPVPRREHVAADERAGARGVLGDQRLDLGRVVVGQLLEVDELEVAAALELPVDVVHVRDPAAHPSREVAAGRARARPRGRRSCTRSHDRPRPRRRPARRSCAPRSARPRGLGRTPGRRWRRTARCCRRSCSPRRGTARARAGAPTRRRPTGPCRCSRWSRRAARTSRPAQATPRSSARPSPRT